MALQSPTLGFVECADLIRAQKYGAALQGFKRSISKLLESKSSPKRSEVALQLLEIATALEETLRKTFGDKWDAHIPMISEEGKEANCSFCGKGQHEVRKLIAGHSVHICEECVDLCDEILTKESVSEAEVAAKSASTTPAQRLCGICMEPRETDELVFLPHAAYLCAGCLEEIQTVRGRRTGK